MDSLTYELIPGELSLNHVRLLQEKKLSLKLHESSRQRVEASALMVSQIVQGNAQVYGINTGFGSLANTPIAKEQQLELQRRLILSHAVGTGEKLADEVVRLILLLKINSLAAGYSGVTWQIIDALFRFYQAEIYPCIPAKGSVGASGDLAPLAHLSAALLGVGTVSYQHKILPATEGLAIVGLSPLQLQAKEGLALINGTQVSTALALVSLFRAENVFAAAMVAGSLTTDAVQGSLTSFDRRIQQVRGQQGQELVASVYRDLLEDSTLRQHCLSYEKMQDPYSIRCQPQVMGACLDHLVFAASILEREANGTSDNPLIFAKDKVILSGGNFHGEPVAMACDTLALAIAEIGALSERRIAILINKNQSGLPAFLVQDPGINSGFMIAQVTAASLASENKSLAHPACVDSIPTSADQEDHVSMATFAARRLLELGENTGTIVAIELLAACQGLDFQKPLLTSEKLQIAYDIIRHEVAFYASDRFFAPDLEKIKTLVLRGEFNDFIPSGLTASL